MQNFKCPIAPQEIANTNVKYGFHATAILLYSILQKYYISKWYKLFENLL